MDASLKSLEAWFRSLEGWPKRLTRGLNPDGEQMSGHKESCRTPGPPPEKHLHPLLHSLFESMARYFFLGLPKAPFYVSESFTLKSGWLIEC